MSAPARESLETPDPAAIRPIRLARLTLETNLVLAPMAGVSNLPFRLISREAGAALAFTETVSAKGLVRGGKKSWHLLRTSPREAPVAFQLFGSEPEVLAEACGQLAAEGAVWVDLNMGCPVKKFIRNCAGSALLREPDRVGRIVAAMREAFPGTLSVKVRTGWDADSINAPEIARIAVDAGAELVSVHGRTRAQQYRGKANRDHIARVVEAVPEVPVLANGDVVRPEHVFDMLRETGAAGVMIGRGAMGNPWIFRQALDLAHHGRHRRPSADERRATIDRHIGLMREAFDDERVLANNLKKYVNAYSKGMVGSADFRTAVNVATELEAVLDLAREFFGRPDREAA